MCKVCKVRSVDYNAERSRMTARLCGKVCKESMQCVQARVFAHTRTHLPPKSRACAKKGRLDTSARCRQKGPSPCVCVLPSRALHTFHTLSQAAAKSMHRQKPPRRTPARSCILCILFIFVLNIERDIRRREEHVKWMQCTPTTTHPVSSEKSVQSMQSALAEL